MLTPEARKTYVSTTRTSGSPANHGAWHIPHQLGLSEAIATLECDKSLGPILDYFDATSAIRRRSAGQYEVSDIQESLTYLKLNRIIPSDISLSQKTLQAIRKYHHHVGMKVFQRHFATETARDNAILAWAVASYKLSHMIDDMQAREYCMGILEVAMVGSDKDVIDLVHLKKVTGESDEELYERKRKAIPVLADKLTSHLEELQGPRGRWSKRWRRLKQYCGVSPGVADARGECF